MKKILLMLLGVLMPLTAMARAFEYTYEGQTLTYSVLDEDAKTCQTKPGGYLVAGNNTSGDLVIPAEVSDGTSTYSVTAIGKYGFYETSLTSVIIPSSVTLIDGYAFAKCKGLTSVTIPDSVTSIGEDAFAWSSGLTTITIPDSVKSIGIYAFFYCTGLTSVVISNSVTLIDDYTFANCSGLTSVTIPNSVTSIGERAFAWCEGLTTVTIPDSVKSIGEYTFFYCDGLKEINYITKQPVTADKTVFSNDTYNTATLNVAPGGLDNAKSTEPWTNFENIQEEGIVRLDGVIYTLYTPEGAEPYAEVTGNYLTKNTDLVIPSSVTKSGVDYPVTTIGSEAFQSCLYLHSIEIPNSVTTIGDFAFQNCIRLASVVIPNSVTTIGDLAFSNCLHLASVVIPDSVTTISDDAFSFCNSLTSLTIPNSVTTIGDFAFANCLHLASVVIPNSVTTIGNYAFADCDALKEVNYVTTNPIAANKNVFSDDTYSSATLNVGAGGLDNAKLTEPWKYFEKITENVFSSINEAIDNFEVNAKIEVYDLNGVNVSNATDDLAPGIYIIRQASKVSKTAVK